MLESQFSGTNTVHLSGTDTIDHPGLANGDGVGLDMLDNPPCEIQINNLLLGRHGLCNSLGCGHRHDCKILILNQKASVNANALHLLLDRAFHIHFQDTQILFGT